VIALAGVACSGSGSTAPDAAALPLDTALAPDAAASAPDAAMSGADTAVDVPADFSPPPDVIVAALDADVDAFFFGPTVAGCESPMPAVVTVRNTGSVASGVLRVSLEGSSPDRFRVDKDGCSGKSLPTSGTCVIEVRFVPRQLVGQPLMAELVVGGAAGESATTALTGEANLTHYDVFPWSQTYLAFPSTPVGTASAAMEAVWTNNTDFSATVGQPSLTGPAAGEFIVTDGCGGQTFAAHQSCRVGLRFQPSMVGQRAATFTLAATGACGYFFGSVLTLSGLGE